jgi:tRNA pseudouridine13 synthase
VTQELPGVGGRLKVKPEDFQVTEIPAYPAQGQGDHWFLYFEKRNLSTPEAVTRLARALDIKPFEIGVAGRKDRHAITRQWISLPPPNGKKLEQGVVEQAVQSAGLTLLELKAHPQKLRTGHLSANRFDIVLRGVAPGAKEKALAVLARLREIGVPNFFGAQRFGDKGRNVARGRDLLLKGTRGRGRDVRFDASALQSDLFNRYLVKRVGRGLYTTALLGDVMKKHESGGLFTCEEPEVDQARVTRLEISPTGPIFGAKMLDAQHDSAALEAETLKDAELSREQFEPARDLMPGTRRAIRFPLEGAEVEEQEDALRFSFLLPKGAYATVMLGEVQKSDAALLDEED